MKRPLCLILTLLLFYCAMPCIAETAQSGGDLSRLNVPKTVYAYNEPILISAIGDGTDWVGIYSPTLTGGSMYWTYVTQVGSGKEFDMREIKQGNIPHATLPAGTYTLRLMPDDATNTSLAIAWVEITVLPEVVSGGDLSRLNVPQTVYAYGEPILISAIGSGTDWVGIYSPTLTGGSMYWTYVTEVGSGAEFDMGNVAHGNIPKATLPAGNYTIRLMPNDTTNVDLAVAWVEITVQEPDVSQLGKALTAEYVLANPDSGCSEGTLTITLADGCPAKDIVCYWVNENGRLPGYTALAKFKVSGTTTVRQFPANTLIPAGATGLRVHLSIGDMLSEEYVEIALPEGAASKPLGEPIVEFQVVSDVHIRLGSENLATYVQMLRDVATVSPDSIGIFISGDIADNGQKAEYDKLVELHASVEGVPNFYMTIGNHDFVGGIPQFLCYTYLPDGTHPDSTNYDFWLNGYHFVFLDGNGAISSATLQWLDQTLAQDRDEQRPVFIFLHQSIYNTVAGSLPGQGWHGVVNPEALSAVLRKYPEVIMFNGHSHWEMDSDACMYTRTEQLPTIFNTAAVAYLWSSYDIPGGEWADGSQGYYVRVYEDMVAVLGREFTTGEWVASAQFVVR